jgi:hypothetical protein
MAKRRKGSSAGGLPDCRDRPPFVLDRGSVPFFTRSVSHIHFVGGEKGGVGKSVVARVLAQRFIDRSVPFAAIDGDQSSGALVRYYGDFTQSVDLGATESADQIMDRALGAERRVLVDLPAQSARSLWSWLSGASVFEFARETGIRLSFWHVTDGGFASVSEIERALKLFGAEAQHFVVKNRGRSRDFSQFDQSEAKRELDALSGKILELPELDASAMYAIDRFGSSFWAAIHRADGDAALKPLERRRVQLWLDQCYAQLDGFDGAI